MKKKRKKTRKDDQQRNACAKHKKKKCGKNVQKKTPMYRTLFHQNKEAKTNVSNKQKKNKSTITSNSCAITLRTFVFLINYCGFFAILFFSFQFVHLI